MTATQTTWHTITLHGDRIIVVGDIRPQNRKILLGLATVLIDEGKRCVIDLAKAGYIDASGIGTLITLARDAKEKGVELLIANASTEFRQLVEKTDALHDVFTFAEPAPA